MCIGFIKVATSTDDKYKLILLNNRDEDLDRPTAKIHWHDGILSGGIVNEYLKSGVNSSKFFENLKSDAEKYNGFQFVGIERNNSSGLFEIRSITNHLVNEIEIIKWNNEFLVYSNSPPHVPFKKAEFGLDVFSKKLQNTNEMEIAEIFEALFDIATCRKSCFPDDQIRVQTGLPEPVYKPLTSIFVRFPEMNRYGTRSHTIIIVDKNDHVTVLERRMETAKNVEESTWHDEKITFQLL